MSFRCHLLPHLKTRSRRAQWHTSSQPLDHSQTAMCGGRKIKINIAGKAKSGVAAQGWMLIPPRVHTLRMHPNVDQPSVLHCAEHVLSNSSDAPAAHAGRNTVSERGVTGSVCMPCTSQPNWPNCSAGAASTHQTLEKIKIKNKIAHIPMSGTG